MRSTHGSTHDGGVGRDESFAATVVACTESSILADGGINKVYCSRHNPQASRRNRTSRVEAMKSWREIFVIYPVRNQVIKGFVCPAKCSAGTQTLGTRRSNAGGQYLDFIRKMPFSFFNPCSKMTITETVFQERNTTNPTSNPRNIGAIPNTEKHKLFYTYTYTFYHFRIYVSDRPKYIYGRGCT